MSEKPVKLTFDIEISHTAPTPPAVPNDDLFSTGASVPFVIKCTGRVGWALLSLLRAGATGCTPINRPAPRWSHYIHCLRGLGVVVETIHEGHEGSFAGHHARYVLRDKVTILPGGTLGEYLASPEGHREFGSASFVMRAAA